MKQNVIIENIAGASQLIGTEKAVRAKPDGHTILFVSSSTTVLDPVLKASLPYDLSKDLAAGCGIVKNSIVMNMTTALPFKTVAEFVAAAKAEPDKYTFAYASGTTQLAGELFQQASGVKLKGVGYKGSADGLRDVAGGFVHLFFIDPVSAGPHYANGRIRPLVAAGRERDKLLPDVPSALEAGLPAFDIWPTFATWLPAGTPPEMLGAARAVLDKASRSPEFATVLEKYGVAPFNVCGEDLARYTRVEIARWTEIAQKAGIEKQ